MNIDKARSIIVKILLATLVATSLVAVGVILLGSVSGMLWRVIGTLIAGAFYLLVILGILSTIPHVGNGPKARSSIFIINTALALTCASYLTSILSIWTVISGDLPLRVHFAYIILLSGVLYAKPFIDLELSYPKIKPYLHANYFFIGLTAVLTAGGIVAPTEWDIWNGFYGRLIAASAVITVTISMVITVLYQLHLQQHPELRAKILTVETVDGQPTSYTTPHRPQNTSVWIVIGIVLFLIFGLPMLFGLLGALLGLFGGFYGRGF